MTSGLRIGFVRRGRCVPEERKDFAELFFANAGAANDTNMTNIKTAAQIMPCHFRNTIGLSTGLIRLGYMVNLPARNVKIEAVDSDFGAC
jgi:hypothetical protein